ncbi:MAG: alpha/beta hydrolase [Pseudomonadota bacterium]
MLGTVPALRVVPPGPVRRTIFYLHGGAFVFGAPQTHAAMLAQIARAAEAEAILPYFPLAPESPFPAAVDAVRAAWNARAPEGPVIIGGDSAGGNLALGLLGGLLAEGAKPPGAAFGLSPLTDLTYSGASVRTNADRDVLLDARAADRVSAMYLPNGSDPQDPRVSPLFADFRGMPPVWLTVGDTEILLDDSRRIAAKMRADGGQVTLDIQPDLPHVWPLFHNMLPEARATIRTLGQWIKTQTPVSES